MLVYEPVQFRKMKTIPFPNSVHEEVQGLVQVVNRLYGLDDQHITFLSGLSDFGPRQLHGYFVAPFSNRVRALREARLHTNLFEVCTQ